MPIAEVVTLETLEAMVERGLASFVEVGNALRTIRDENLYPQTHGTFEAYCKDRWGMYKERYLYYLMDSAKVIGGLHNCAILPTTESQARELTGIRDEEGELDLVKINEAWQEAVETAPEGVITAAHVKKVVRDIAAREEGPDPEPKQEEKKPEAVGGAFTENYVTMAISHLKRIDRADPGKKAAGIKVIAWCIKNLCGGEYNEFRSKKNK